MRLAVDAVGVRPGSAAIIISNILFGWTDIAPDDEIVVLVDGAPRFPVPPSATVQSLSAGDASLPQRLVVQSLGVRRAARRVRADAVLSAVTAGALAGVGCRYGALLYDLRHEQRPHQFPLRRRVARRVLYGWTFRHADAIFCISERTRRDLVASRPRLRGKAHVSLLGADHAASWRPPEHRDGRYLLAFGHFPNKNIDAVLRAWQRLSRERDDLRLRICGLSKDGRAGTEKTVSDLGIRHVELLGWLSDDEFHTVFAGASGVLFPSDFEGFGLPAIEALRLGIPLVISNDPALLEVTAGHAVVAADNRPDTLARAVAAALDRTPEQIAAGVDHALGFTWARTASQIRAVLVATCA